ncbi:MAG TPA: ribonuclease E/G, partial [Rhodothermia bacterium]
MSKEIVIQATKKETRIAIIEDGQLAELYFETPDNARTIGDIYLGRVRNVMPSIQAAFVNVGQKQDAFLHFSDVGETLEDLLKMIGEQPTLSDIDVHVPRVHRSLRADGEEVTTDEDDRKDKGDKRGAKRK